jgi:uncharacterized protein (DUF4213/DUF364 family)
VSEPDDDKVGPDCDVVIVTGSEFVTETVDEAVIRRVCDAVRSAV